MEENNPKEFWKLVNSIKSRQSESVSNEVTNEVKKNPANCRTVWPKPSTDLKTLVW